MAEPFTYVARPDRRHQPPANEECIDRAECRKSERQGSYFSVAAEVLARWIAIPGPHAPQAEQRTSIMRPFLSRLLFLVGVAGRLDVPQSRADALKALDL